MAEKAKSGDTVKLAKGEGIFVDYETGFEVFNKNEEKLGKNVGKATHQAILSGGLLVVQSKSAGKDSSKNQSKDQSDLPQEIPGHDVLVREGITLEQVKGMDKAALEAVKGIGAKTADHILEYFKQ